MTTSAAAALAASAAFSLALLAVAWKVAKGSAVTAGLLSAPWHGLHGYAA
jgi:hypothetical protein